MIAPDRLHRIFTILPWVAGPLFFGLFALALGQDANWDLRNYHLYNPFAFLHHRLDYDVVPAQVANFYNPLLYIPFYGAVMHLPPKVVGFLLGAVQGLNFPILLGIIRCVLPADSAMPRWHWYLIALIGMLGAANISELGTMFADNLISLPVLAAVWLLLAQYRHLVAAAPSRRALLTVAVAGLLMGMAAGLKQPSAIFAVGWCVALLVLPLPMPRRIWLAFLFGGGVLAGIGLTGGYWLYELWSRYANPLFPYFNRFFRSPMASLADYRDIEFLPPTLIEALLLPFLILLDPYRSGEIFFRDLRFPLLYVLLVAAGLYALRRLPGRHDSAEPRQGFFLLAGIVAAYAVWMRIFGIYRYLVPLEMLAPLAIWLLIDRFPWRQVTRQRVALGCGLLLLVTLYPGNWGRVAWGEDYFGVEVPELAEPKHTMVLLTGREPLAYLIPFFPPAVRFVRIESYFTGPSETPNGFDRRMEELIADHRGPLYVIYRLGEGKESEKALRAYGLISDPAACELLRPHIEKHLKAPLAFCPVRRMNGVNQGGTGQ